MKTHEISLNLFNKFENLDIKHEIIQYPGILALFALIKTAESINDEESIKKAVEYLKKFPEMTKNKRYNYDLYHIGGTAIAYAFMRGYYPEAKELIREYAEKTMNAPKNSDGLVIKSTTPDRDCVWIDSIAFVVPFLLYAGIGLNEPKYIDEAVHQALGHYDLLLDKDTGLLHQCYNFVAIGDITEDHWGRGNGWGYIALTELVEWLPKDHPSRAKVELYFSRHSCALRKYQTKRGFWCQEIPIHYSYEESSGTGLMLYGFAIGMKHRLLDKNSFMEPFQRGLNGLLTFAIYNDFSTDRCCRGMCCAGFGYEKGTTMAYAQTLPETNNSHSFGSIMLPYAVAGDIGVNEAHRMEELMYKPEWDT